MFTNFAKFTVHLCASGPLETGPQEGVVAAGVGVVEEDEAWDEVTASTPVERETLTDTVAVTNRKSVLNSSVLRDEIICES